MKVVDVKAFVVGNPPPHRGGNNWVFVKLTTDSGITGVGEAYWIPFKPETAVKMIEDVAERYLIGHNPFQIELFWRRAYGNGHPDVSKMGCISALDMALWDIVGKELNQPIYNLLGGKIHEKMWTYTYIYCETDIEEWYALQTDPERAPKAAAEYVKRGFSAVKFDPIITTTILDPRQVSINILDNCEKVVGNVREAVGSKCEILIGTHAQFTPSSAIRFARRLERFDPLFFEEPLPLENRRELATVARATSIPIATGERLSTKFEFKELLENQSAEILQMALGRVGGITEAKKIAGMAEAHYAQLAPHLWCGPIELAASIQVMATCPNFLILECIDDLNNFHSKLLKKPIRWENGYIIPPDGPGLGVEIDEDVAAKHPMIP